MYIHEEDKNPELYTETYDRWEDWMVGEVVYYIGHCVGEWGVVTKLRGYLGDMLWVRWEKNEREELSAYLSSVRFKKRNTSKDSEAEVLVWKTVRIPTQIKFQDRVYVLKEDVV